MGQVFKSNIHPENKLSVSWNTPHHLVTATSIYRHITILEYPVMTSPLSHDDNDFFPRLANIFEATRPANTYPARPVMRTFCQISLTKASRHWQGLVEVVDHPGSIDCERSSIFYSLSPRLCERVLAERNSTVPQASHNAALPADPSQNHTE